MRTRALLLWDMRLAGRGSRVYTAVMRAPLAAALLVLASAAPGRANLIAGPVTSEQAAEGRKLLESHNGAGARGCLTEWKTYEAFHRVDPALAWNPDNPGDWYVVSHTAGLIEEVILQGYGELSRQWNSLRNGTDFAAIGAPCGAARSPRALAACLNDSVHGYFAAHPDIHASMGGDCKMYSATLVAVAERFPAVTREAAITSSLQHAINKVEIRDAQGRTHVFLIDSLNNLVIQLSGAGGSCPDEGTLAPAPAATRAPAGGTALERQKEAARRAGAAAGSALP